MSVKIKKDMQVSSESHIIEVRPKKIYIKALGLKKTIKAAAEVMGAGSGVILPETYQSPALGAR